ncbi:phage tail family protein [Cellulosimicrobium sp. JZ28]|uniref:phage tail family protein n=1 Tax=Cellulosimicrobium sp. JZ28 TaxID=1906273 RepID=UPI00188B78EC|nr:phage tail family protein [Cellulosimicrobium sp. JZ28]
MSVKAVTTSAPVLPYPWSATIDGLPVGRGTPFSWTYRDGFHELPPMQSADVPRPNGHGTFGSRDWAQGRFLTARFQVHRPVGVGFDEAVEAARRVLVPSESTVPVWVNMPGRGPVRWDAKVRRARVVTDEAYNAGLARIDVQLFAPDPVGYGPEQVAGASFPELVGGLEFDLFTDGSVDTGFLEFGERGETGRVRLTNGGTADAYSIFHVEGPAADGFELVAVGVGRRIRWEGRLFAGDLLTVNPARGTALLNGTADRSGLFTRREWFAVPPGEELEVQFLPVGASVGARVSVESSSAWW